MLQCNRCNSKIKTSDTEKLGYSLCEECKENGFFVVPEFVVSENITRRTSLLNKYPSWAILQIAEDCATTEFHSWVS
jgi:hypothetical protein